MIDITTIETPDLGDRSYLVSDGRVGAVVDPQRDIDRMLALADAVGVEIALVLETHIHNDYVTGGLELARATGATYAVAAAENVAYERYPVEDGDRLTIGSFHLEALHTPGHTPTHLSYAVWPQETGSADHVAPTGSGPLAVFTGGSLLYGTVGRTDLIGEEMTEQLTRSQYHSARRLAALPDQTEVFPTHGFGSFCSSASGTGAHASTIGRERTTNLALTTPDEELFLASLIAGLSDHPRYYTHMAPINRAGPAPIDLSPPETFDAAELRRRIDRGEWVVDVRSRKAFARSHMAGTIGIEGGSGFVTYLGWLIPWGTPVTLIGDTTAELDAAQRSMARIGIDRPAGRATGGIASWSDGSNRSYADADFHELSSAMALRDDLVLLDVRRAEEWASGHIRGSINIPLHDLESEIGSVPDGEVWVHCESALRAAIAASLLDRRGRSVVLVDDDFTKAPEAGLPIEQELMTMQGIAR